MTLKAEDTAGLSSNDVTAEDAGGLSSNDVTPLQCGQTGLFLKGLWRENFLQTQLKYLATFTARYFEKCHFFN